MAGTIQSNSCAKQTEETQKEYRTPPLIKKRIESLGKINNLYLNLSPEEKKWDLQYPDILKEKIIPKVQKKLIDKEGPTAGKAILQKLAAYQFAKCEGEIYQK
jgi:hypothetical protein